MKTYDATRNGPNPLKLQELTSSLEQARETVAHLRDQLKLAQQTCKRIELEVDQYKASFGAPIHQCPQEVLMIIFDLYLLENPRLVRRLLLVCRQWYQTASSAPRLWNRIPVTLDSDWKLEAIARSISRRVKMCLQRSGTLVLELDINFSGLTTSEYILIQEFRDLLYSRVKDTTFLNNWIEGLPIDELEDPSVISACHPSHALSLLQKMTGIKGEHMIRWGSLRLTLPYEDTTETLSLQIWTLLSYPTPNLTQLALYNGYDVCVRYKTEGQGALPNLLALKHLDVHSLEEVDGLNIQPDSLRHFVVHYGSSMFPSIARFTQLQTLRLVGDNRSSERTSRPTQRTSVSLPNLRQLLVESSFKRLEEIEFLAPVLDRLVIVYGGFDAAYAKVQASHVSWRWNATWDSQHETRRPKHIKPVIRSALLQYPSTTRFDFPRFAKDSVLHVLRELKAEGNLSSSLNSVMFEDEAGYAGNVEMRDL